MLLCLQFNSKPSHDWKFKWKSTHYLSSTSAHLCLLIKPYKIQIKDNRKFQNRKKKQFLKIASRCQMGILILKGHGNFVSLFITHHKSHNFCPLFWMQRSTFIYFFCTALLSCLSNQIYPFQLIRFASKRKEGAANVYTLRIYKNSVQYIFKQSAFAWSCDWIGDHLNFVLITYYCFLRHLK